MNHKVKNTEKLLNLKKVLKTLVIVALVTIIVSTSFEIMPVKGELQTQPPTDEEKAIFHTKRNRYKDLGQKSVNDIFNSLGADGSGQWVSVATKVCPKADYDSCEIIIRAELVHFNCTIPPADADGKFGRKDANTNIENRVKKLRITFFLMINPELAREAEGTGVGQIDDDRLLYHELLHGQIKVDEMKNPTWAGWNNLCECKPLSEWGDMIGAADPDHKTIPGLEDDYRNRLATDRNYSLTYYDETITTGDEGYFDVQFPIPWEDEKPDEYWDWWGHNTDDIEILILHWPDHYVRIKGRLVPIVKDGKAVVYIDPDNLGMIIHLDIFAPPPVGGIVVPVDKFGLLAPYIGLASTIIVATVATAIYVKRVKRGKEKCKK
ncbi:hypothetical protein MUP01_05815 [Candidatus Bathyarchaeota archaeon]|nr:hypothetical protein [Candidatus Bathyarchaeota archaeon]